MFGSILSWLAFKGVKSSVVEILLIVALAVAALVAVVVWFNWHDATVIADHDAAQEAETTKRALGAERSANFNAAVRADEARRNQETLRNVQEAAEKRDPQGAARPVGPVTGSVIDELRRQHSDGPSR
jgi:Flp pilus assembly protein CpaB